MLRLEVYGEPIPQGSKKAFVPKGRTRAVIVDDNKDTLKPWRQAIIDAAQGQLPREHVPLDCACELYVTFFVRRPTGLPKRVTEPITRPDLDKYLRAACDALTAAGVWRDDARCILKVSRKAYAAGIRDPRRQAGVPRAVIEVREASTSAGSSMARLFGEATA
jgi:Holliday junction resolvase RusA-like endonuclease